MTDEISKTLDELKGKASVKRLRTHSHDNFPAIDVWVRREHYRLEFPGETFAISRIRKSTVVQREEFEAYE